MPDLDQSKAAVIGSLRSSESQRGYRHAIDEFNQWYCSEPRLSFNRTVVLRNGCSSNPAIWLRAQSTYDGLRYDDWRTRPPGLSGIVRDRVVFVYCATS